MSAGRAQNLLVFGASGQIGRFLLPRIRARGLPFRAVSRRPQVDPETLCFDIYNDATQRPEFDALLSAGPLDGCVRWLKQQGRGLRRVVAFASTSVLSKRDSPDPHERALAATLLHCEQELAELCQARDAALTVLRPTMIWGAGRDATLTRAAHFARRWRVLPCSGRARRQPVHADDLAQAALAALALTTTPQGHYDLPGGETLSMREALRRIARSVGALAVPVPAGLLGLLGAGVRARLDSEFLFDAAPARRDLAYQPRGFTPQLSDWYAQ